MTRIVLVRHGQASFGSADYDQLSPAGLEQARLLGPALATRLPAVDAVVCGTMRRHRQTAEICLAGMGQPAGWTADAGWNEFDHRAVLAAFEPRYRDHGELHRDLARSGRPTETFVSIFDAAVDRWVGGTHDRDYDETWAGFLSRVDGALERLLRGGGGTVLVFTSGGPISAACRSLVPLPRGRVLDLAFRLANASVTELDTEEGGLTVRSFNDHAHFCGGAARLLTFR